MQRTRSAAKLPMKFPVYFVNFIRTFQIKKKLRQCWLGIAFISTLGAYEKFHSVLYSPQSLFLIEIFHFRDFVFSTRLLAIIVKHSCVKRCWGVYEQDSIGTFVKCTVQKFNNGQERRVSKWRIPIFFGFETEPRSHVPSTWPYFCTIKFIIHKNAFQ